MQKKLKSINEEINIKLPKTLTWNFLQEPLVIHFYSLTKLNYKHIPFQFFKSHFETYYTFATTDYANGGGASYYICLNTDNNYVIGLDIEREQGIFIFNTSIKSFIETFQLIDYEISKSNSIDFNLHEKIKAIDLTTYEISEWKSLVDALIDG